MLTSQEQQVWDDVQRYWDMDVEEPPGLALPAHGRTWIVRDQADLPVAVAAGAWIAITLVLFGAVLAGLAVAVATAVGGTLWQRWPRSSGTWRRPADEHRIAD